jgi:hypothetical protein
MHARLFEKQMKLKDLLVHCDGDRSRITEPFVGPVIAARSREVCYARLHQRPVSKYVSKPILENYRGRPSSLTVNVKTITSDVNHSSRQFVAQRLLLLSKENCRRER